MADTMMITGAFGGAPRSCRYLSGASFEGAISRFFDLGVDIYRRDDALLGKMRAAAKERGADGDFAWR